MGLIRALAVLTLCVSGTAVTGCASSGPTGTETLTGSIKPGLARLVIYRSNAMGFAVQPEYTVDKKKAGVSQPKGFVVCELQPGKHEVSVGNFALNVNFGGGTDHWDLDLKPNTTTYLQAEPKMGLTVGVVTLNQVTEQQGRNETADLHKIESSC